ncbi:MAG: PilX N-terminal domain-containing pilus assembly protein [Rubrivivax sp.]|nr:PilX N-terminal domain-containing pilus assembly protein [Rubrivivax sp.]
MTTHPCTRCGGASGAKQRGSALIVVMLLLVITMLMAVSSVRTANLEERMASNTRERQVAFQLAEAALRDAEQVIADDADGPFRPLRPGMFSADCLNGLCRSAPGAPLWTDFSDSDWASGKTWAYGAATGATALAGAAAGPRYVIEFQGTAQPIEPGKPCVALYLLTARARGASAATDVVLQSVYRHRVGECYAAI